MDETPDWYDEDKVTRATFAEGYNGYVVDLGDGTCRFTNAPLLGESGPKWGDRVDLFYNPCMPFEMPRVGYRVYKDGEEPVGRSFGLETEPDAKEIAEHKEEQKQRETREVEMIGRNFDSMFGRLSAWHESFEKANWQIRYFELKHYAETNGLEIPGGLHDKLQRWGSEPDSANKTRRKELKTMMLAALQAQFSDVVVTDEEVDALAADYRSSTTTADILTEKFAEQIAKMTEEEEEDD